MYPKKDNTFSMLAGAALGAVAMYLLDPDSGRRRREQITAATGGAMHEAGARLHPIMDRVTESARSIGSTIAENAGAIRNGIAEKYATVREGHPVQNLGEHVSELSSNIADRFRNAGHRARETAGKLGSEWLHHEEPSHTGRYATAGAAGVGTLLLGAGLMYLFDPARGRSRRVRMMDKATSIVRRTGNTACQFGKDLRNRAKGYAHEARSMVTPAEPVSAETLLARVRSELGHAVSHVDAIQVMTDDYGRVTLHGKVLASEADTMLCTVKGVAGVNEVVNLISVKETEQQMSESSPTGSGAQL